MELQLTDKVVLITGASRGIGAACARALAACGAKVVVNYLQAAAQARAVVAEIEAAGGQALALPADVRDPEAVAQMVRTAVRELGPIDVLVNNAHINFPIQPLTTMAWPEIEAKLTGEIKALYNCCQAVLPAMRERKAGKLILVSSTLSRSPGEGFAAHSAAKAALDAMARGMAMELGPEGITVNVVSPGLTATDATADLPPEMKEFITAATPLRRVGIPEDVAGAVVFLASALADYITGQYLPVNGGNYMA
ncbi:SDR family oxidoreductase [Desulfurivibrio sp. D14AmB]|uniref:SDR family oxidoreductase n=1 Tax=Desulfurivibrio sp. D14AmB TaxID=3374370 RepID=UPI00376F35A7